MQYHSDDWRAFNADAVGVFLIFCIALMYISHTFINLINFYDFIHTILVTGRFVDVRYDIYSVYCLSSAGYATSETALQCNTSSKRL